MPEKARGPGPRGPPHLPRDGAVREFLGEFDLFVLSSYNEGQPIVVLEAMTAGIPMVGTDVGGMAQARSPIRWCPPAARSGDRAVV